MKYTSEGRADMIVQKKENAVSPAIATVLLVLMTVLIAAVIAVVVTGMAGDQTNYVVGLTADPAQSGGNVTVTLYGGKDLPNLVKAEVIDAGSAKGEFVEVWKGAAGTALTGVPLVAESVARPEEDRAEYATRIMTKGTFADGTEQVLLERAVTFRGVQSVGTGDEEPEDLRKNAVVTVKAKDQIMTKADFEKIMSDPLKNDGLVTVNGLINGDKLKSVTLTLSGTNPYTIGVSDCQIVDNKEQDVISKYGTVSYETGNLDTAQISLYIGESTAKVTHKIGYELKTYTLKLTIPTQNKPDYKVNVMVNNWIAIDNQWGNLKKESQPCSGKSITISSSDITSNMFEGKPERKVDITVTDDTNIKVATETYYVGEKGTITSKNPHP